jgi:hypothetical protein
MVHLVEGASFVFVGAVAAIREKAKGREVVGGVGGGKAVCGEVEVPMTSFDAGIDTLAGGIQLTDAFEVGPVSGHVSSDPPVCELLAPVNEEGENVIRPTEQLSEPLWEGLAWEVLLTLAGVVGEGVEGVVVNLPVIPGESTHGSLCVGGVVRGDSDVSSPGTVPEVGDGKGGETPLIVDEINGTLVTSVDDGGGGGLASESGDLAFEVGGEGIVDRQAINEGLGEVLGDRPEVTGGEVVTLQDVEGGTGR